MSKPFAAERIERYTHILSALANPVRLKLLFIIAGSKRAIHIKGLARQLGIDYAAIYRHIAILKGAGLVEVYEVGRSRVPAIRDPQLLETLFKLIGRI